MLEADGDPEFMTSLARGLAVLRCFADEQRPMTIAQASRATDLGRSAVKRCLHTLTRLGYASQEGGTFTLRPKVLELGYAFMSSSTLAMRAQPLLDQLRDELHESCSLGVLEEDEVCYLARAEVGRIMSVTLRVGSRLPVYCTSMGRVLMAGQDPPYREAYLRRANLVRFTPRTEIETTQLLALFNQVKGDGFAIVDQELEIGLRSVSVPVLGPTGLVAAVNIGTHAARVPLGQIRDRYVPALRRVARDLAYLL